MVNESVGGTPPLPEGSGGVPPGAPTRRDHRSIAPEEREHVRHGNRSPRGRNFLCTREARKKIEGRGSIRGAGLSGATATAPVSGKVALLRAVSPLLAHVLYVWRVVRLLFSCCRMHAPHPPVQVGDVIAKSDYIVVVAALTPETKGMVGAAELARVRRVVAAVRSLTLSAATVLRGGWLQQVLGSTRAREGGCWWNFAVYSPCRRRLWWRERRLRGGGS